jgi:hypothetical protein
MLNTAPFDPFTSPIIKPRWHDRIIIVPIPQWQREWGVIVEGDCCVWTGAKNHRGYGYVLINGKSVRLHRYVFMQFHDIDVSPSHVIDHLCRIRACFNPHHHEAVTWLENFRRGDGPKHTFKPAASYLSIEDTEALAGL